MTDSDDDKVGYKNPPKKHRWGPGQSGNKKGRPKKEKILPGKKDLFSEDLAKAMSRKIPVTEKGIRVRKRAEQVMVTRLVDNAITGKIKAFKELCIIIEILEEDQPTKLITVLGKDEIRAIGFDWRDSARKLLDEEQAYWRALKEQGPGLKEALYAELNKSVAVTIGGEKTTRTKHQLIVESLMAKALKGDFEVFRLLLQFTHAKRKSLVAPDFTADHRLIPLLRRHFAPETWGPPTEEDLRL